MRSKKNNTTGFNDRFSDSSGFRSKISTDPSGLIIENNKSGPMQVFGEQSIELNGRDLPLIDPWHDIEADLGSLVKSLEQAYFQWQTSKKIDINPAFIDAKWHAFLNQFRSEITQLNQRVSDYNTQVPLSSLQKPFFMANTIITKLTDQKG